MKKECVFTLVPASTVLRHRTRIPGVNAAPVMSSKGPTTSPLKLDCRSREFHLLTGRGHIAKDFGPKLFKGRLNATLTGLVYFTQAFFKKTNFTLNFGGWEVSVDQPQRTDLFSFGPRYPVGYCNSENENG